MFNGELKSVKFAIIFLIIFFGLIFYSYSINEEFESENKVTYSTFLKIKDMDIKIDNNIIQINKVSSLKILTFNKFFKVENNTDMDIFYNYLNNELVCDKSGFKYEFIIKDEELLIENISLKDIIMVSKENKEFSNLTLIKFFHNFLILI